jgi:hypothetical protein
MAAAADRLHVVEAASLSRLSCCLCNNKARFSVTLVSRAVWESREGRKRRPERFPHRLRLFSSQGDDNEAVSHEHVCHPVAEG